MKLKDLNDLENHNYEQAPQIPVTDIKLLWYTSYYDGIIAGVCEYKGTRMLFKLVDDETNYIKYAIDETPIDSRPYRWWRRFVLVKLHPALVRYEEVRNEDFTNMVGAHCNYGDRRGPLCEDLIKREQFYQKHYSHDYAETYAESEVVGWFELQGSPPSSGILTEGD